MTTPCSWWMPEVLGGSPDTGRAGGAHRDEARPSAQPYPPDSPERPRPEWGPLVRNGITGRQRPGRRTGRYGRGLRAICATSASTEAAATTVIARGSELAELIAPIAGLMPIAVTRMDRAIQVTPLCGRRPGT